MENIQAVPVASTSLNTRQIFIKKTYTHLAGAILVFILVEYILFKTGLALSILELVANSSWLMILGAFMLVSWIANHLAQKTESGLGVQYAGLGLFVVAEALIFSPILLIAMLKTGDLSVIYHAGILTGIMTLGLTIIAFNSGKDFSFLGSALRMMGFIALGLIISGVIFGFNLGLWFSGLMVAFASGAILYDTSNIMHRYREDQYVSASLSLFASVALLFWYILRIFISRD